MDMIIKYNSRFALTLGHFQIVELHRMTCCTGGTMFASRKSYCMGRTMFASSSPYERCRHCDLPGTKLMHQFPLRHISTCRNQQHPKSLAPDSSSGKLLSYPSAPTCVGPKYHCNRRADHVFPIGELSRLCVKSTGSGDVQIADLPTVAPLTNAQHTACYQQPHDMVGSVL